MYQPLIKFHPYPAIITQVLRIFAVLITRFVFEVSENRQSPLLNHNL